MSALFYRPGSNGTRGGAWAVVFCLGLCVLPWVQAQQQASSPGSVGDPLQQARDLLESHDLPEARRLLEDLVERSPGSAEAWLLLSDTYSQLDMEGESIRGYDMSSPSTSTNTPLRTLSSRDSWMRLAITPRTITISCAIGRTVTTPTAGLRNPSPGSPSRTRALTPSGRASGCRRSESGNTPRRGPTGARIPGATNGMPAPSSLPRRAATCARPPTWTAIRRAPASLG
jgi:hypothetical protein